MSRTKKALTGVVVGLVATLTLTNVAVLAGGSFVDVGPSHPFYDEIEWMNATGISEGYEDGTYRPGEPVTRQAMSAFMARLNDTYRVVTDSRDPANGNVISMGATCAPDERVLAGGGDVQGSSTHVMHRSFPVTTTPQSWNVYWRTTDGGNANPTLVQVWALCAPREPNDT